MANNYVILGAYGGIGSALTRRLADAGHRLFLVGRDQARLQPLAAEVGAVGFARADATASAEVESTIADGAAQLGTLDGIANCFGSLLLKPAHLTTDEELEATLAISLKSAFATVRAAARTMKQGGSVVLLSSAAARLGIASHEAIAAAKAGVQGLALSAAATYASRNLRVNCVAPGLTKTPLTERITGNEMAAKGSLAMHALGRFGEASEVASAIAWLLDPEQSWVTGQVIGVDGGLATVRTRG
ncbi:MULTISPECIES: SDR family oxidoreductase [Acidobacterium]|uniref:Oxidoreductase, short chain dehydrogenase/reductase family n=1 Tax=Acidobacterium capsulatum (strain ATCC 51196 / DSM 11244 / BCRC 80197 / JCM 7670 / NBRC 15755 / NCIMB 13165 / 161) TaxID=240015 RepID=C1F7J8_ACIC5|nr:MULTISPECIES: SDR family oxidoreductase [Acidobacterium]ACO32955.1 oxidoreductase, short chain dehydrogenase/reductase family [Acidobacterium capsulatum ATCC 51196]HCT59617.1 NAD(P)-dependent oxidoreductase [Acidobacterium sp.]